jgi:hypothetical protein
MREAFAVTGYVPSHRATALGGGQPGPVDVGPEPGHTVVGARLDCAEVDEVRLGPSAHGETLVQLILRPDAKVQAVQHLVANVAGLRRLNDPVLARLTASVHAKSIIV